MHKGCILPRVSLGALSDVTVVFGMRQSIDILLPVFIKILIYLESFLLPILPIIFFCFSLLFSCLLMVICLYFVSSRERL